MANPLSPLIISPWGGASIVITVDNIFSWQSDSSSQSAYYIEYIHNITSASSSNTGWITSSLPQHTFLLNTFTDSWEYKWRVKIRNSSGLESLFSEWALFKAGASAGLTIIFPANDLDILSAVPTYQHTYSNSNNYYQIAYQYKLFTGTTWNDFDSLTYSQQEAKTWDEIETLSLGNTLWDSGRIESTSTSVEQPSEYLEVLQYWYKVQATIWDNVGNEVVSDIRTFGLLVNSIPKIPTIIATSDNPNGRNIITITNPTPDVGQAAAHYNKLYRRKLDNSWELVQDGILNTTTSTSWQTGIEQLSADYMSYYIMGNNYAAQGFKPTDNMVNSHLIKVSLLSGGKNWRPIDTHWHIYNDDAGLPGNSISASSYGIVRGESWPESGQWVSADIALSEPLQANQQYWFVLEGVGDINDWVKFYMNSDAFSNGYYAAGKPWQVQTSFDMTFSIKGKPPIAGYDTTCRSSKEEEYSVSAVSADGIESSKSESDYATCQLSAYWFTNLTTNITVELTAEIEWGQMQSERVREEYIGMDESYPSVCYGSQRFYRGNFQATLLEPTESTWPIYCKTFTDVLDVGNSILMRSPFGDLLELDVYNLKISPFIRTDIARNISFDMVEIAEMVPAGTYTYSTPTSEGYWVVDPTTNLGFQLYPEAEWDGMNIEHDRFEGVGLSSEFATINYGNKKAVRSGFSGVILTPDTGTLAEEIMRLRELIDSLNKIPVIFQTPSGDKFLVDTYGFTYELFDRSSQARKVSFEFVEVGVVT